MVCNYPIHYYKLSLERLWIIIHGDKMKKGLHLFVKKWQTIIFGSLSQICNSINKHSPVRKLNKVIIGYEIILSTSMNGPWKVYLLYNIMVRWKKGLHSFVKKVQAIKCGSLSQIGNTINYLSSVIKLKQVTIQDVIILSTIMNYPWKGY